MRKSNFLALLDMTRCWFNHKLFLSTSPPPRCGTKQTTWFHQRRTELFLSQPTSLLLPTRLGGSVLRCELFMINITNIMDIIYITNAAINHTNPAILWCPGVSIRLFPISSISETHSSSFLDYIVNKYTLNNIYFSAVCRHGFSLSLASPSWNLILFTEFSFYTRLKSKWKVGSWKDWTHRVRTKLKCQLFSWIGK